MTQSRDKQSGTGPPKPVQAARLGAGSVPAPSQTGFHKHFIPKHAGRQTQRNPEESPKRKAEASKAARAGEAPRVRRAKRAGRNS